MMAEYGTEEIIAGIPPKVKPEAPRNLFTIS